jgi:hypothetical protein
VASRDEPMLISLTENMKMMMKGEPEVTIEWLGCNHPCSCINLCVLAGFESTNDINYQTCIHGMEVKNGIRTSGIKERKEIRLSLFSELAFIKLIYSDGT